MKKYFIISILMFLIPVCGSAVVNTGSMVKGFYAETPDGRIINSEYIKGKVVAGFYEDRNATDKNQRLKSELSKFYIKNMTRDNDNKKIAIFKLAVTDGTPANLATKWVWKRKVSTKSAENKMDIYLDWDGNMKRAFEIPDGESTFILIDKEGIVKYIRSGVIPGTEFGFIFSLIKTITE